MTEWSAQESTREKSKSHFKIGTRHFSIMKGFWEKECGTHTKNELSKAFYGAETREEISKNGIWEIFHFKTFSAFLLSFMTIKTTMEIRKLKEGFVETKNKLARHFPHIFTPPRWIVVNR